VPPADAYRGGGAGKTRAALHAARAVAARFEDGVYVVLLAPVTDAKLVAPAIAQALGLPLVGKRSPLDGLKRYLRERNLLLVLDNFEHAIAPDRHQSGGASNIGRARTCRTSALRHR
jgi:predicted ATPase